jgi:hypothetical protein
VDGNGLAQAARLQTTLEFECRLALVAAVGAPVDDGWPAPAPRRTADQAVPTQEPAGDAGTRIRRVKTDQKVTAHPHPRASPPLRGGFRDSSPTLGTRIHRIKTDQEVLSRPRQDLNKLRHPMRWTGQVLNNTCHTGGDCRRSARAGAGIRTALAPSRTDLSRLTFYVSRCLCKRVEAVVGYTNGGSPWGAPGDSGYLAHAGTVIRRPCSTSCPSPETTLPVPTIAPPVVCISKV